MIALVSSHSLSSSLLSSVRRSTQENSRVCHGARSLGRSIGFANAFKTATGGLGARHRESISISSLLASYPHANECLFEVFLQGLLISVRPRASCLPARCRYLLRSRLQADDAYEPENMTRMWREVYNLVSTAARVTGLEHVVLNKKCVLTVKGQPHFIFSRGLPSMSSNCMYVRTCCLLYTSPSPRDRG